MREIAVPSLMPRPTPTIRPLRSALVFLGLVAIASMLRFPSLADRPMHGDEAVHADKFGVLLEQGRYEYSTVDFHGPTLYYLTLIPARLQGVRHYADLNEVTLRFVPAFLGVLLVAAHFLLVPYIGLPAAATAGLLTAVSPAMVYYSRYYIHETLLVFLTFCTLLSVLRYFQARRPSWALVTGVLVGLMYTTKETMIISLGCMLLAVVAMLMVEKLRGDTSLAVVVPARHLAIAVLGALLTTIVLISSFLSNSHGILDSVLAFRSYFERSLGVNTLHIHPWTYYISHLFFYRSAGGPVWSEALIAGLALAGLGAAFSREGVAGVNPRVLRFIAFYALFMVAIYSLIPYKVPWNVLGFLHGMILLSGAGLVWLITAARNIVTKAVMVGLVAVCVVHLGWQARLSSIEYGADPRNPWVYAHTGRDIDLIMKNLEELASVHPGGHSLSIQIVSGENLWPLPWYLRRFSGVRWWNGVSETVAAAPVVLATPDMEPALVRKFYELPAPGQREMYVRMFDGYVELRPRVEVRGYVAKSLWDQSRLNRDAP